LREIDSSAFKGIRKNPEGKMAGKTEKKAGPQERRSFLAKGDVTQEGKSLQKTSV